MVHREKHFAVDMDDSRSWSEGVLDSLVFVVADRADKGLIFTLLYSQRSRGGVRWSCSVRGR